MDSKGVKPFMNATHSSDPINMYTKYLKGYTLLSAQTFLSKVDSREITLKGGNGGQPFLNATHHPDLNNMSTIYHKIFQRVKGVIERTAFPLLRLIKGGHPMDSKGSNHY